MAARHKLVLLATWTLLATAQTSTSRPPAPPLPTKAAELTGFVPPGWTLEHQELADLNGDGSVDALLLLRRQQASGTPERALAVAIRERGRGAGYVLSEMNHRLIPRSDNPEQEDPMEEGELSARRGGFDVKLALKSGAGSYLMATVHYRFRYQDGCFRLIGYDRKETHRATMETRDVSINFLTGLAIHRTGSGKSDSVRERRERLKSNVRRCFRDLDSAATFQPL